MMNRAESTSRPGSSNASNVMYTPRTPRMRERQRFSLGIMPEEDNTDILEDLAGQTWNIYAASALFDFQRDDVHLKLYAKKLREEVASTLSHENVTYDAKFSVTQNLGSSSNHEDYLALGIQVVAKTSGPEKEVEKLIYKGLLLSWRMQSTESSIQNSIKLPLLLCRGTRNCMDAVNAIISRMFDCSVVALSANEDDLSWLIPIIIMSTDKEEQSIISGEVQMQYTVPELPISDTITVKFHTEDLKKILSVIIKDQDTNVNVSLDREDIETFYEVLHKQMLIEGGLKLGLCTLHRINLPGISIMENKMKVTKADVMNNILVYFSDKAIDTFYAVDI
ncbi:PREDICTED: centromere protein L-like [Vollenhovia emeryi]|uniref:centromere protein L-like n=1 Tax=Vollenhovia emeryi TaxID=411798 RepID=UPI0005F3FF7D|nr:PREDICTED: centromere protein L-like [Vollenhovia emeryi]